MNRSLAGTYRNILISWKTLISRKQNQSIFIIYFSNLLTKIRKILLHQTVLVYIQFSMTNYFQPTTPSAAYGLPLIMCMLYILNGIADKPLKYISNKQNSVDSHDGLTAWLILSRSGGHNLCVPNIFGPLEYQKVGQDSLDRK